MGNMCPPLFNSLIVSMSTGEVFTISLVDLTKNFANDKCTGSYSTISLEAPELKKSFIHNAFIRVGDNAS